MILGHSWGRNRSFKLSNLFFVVVEGAVHLKFPRDLVLHHCQSHTEVLQGRHSRHKAITHALLTTHSKIVLQLATKTQAGLVLNLTCGLSMFTSLSTLPTDDRAFSAVVAVCDGLVCLKDEKKHKPAKYGARIVLKIGNGSVTCLCWQN